MSILLLICEPRTWVFLFVVLCQLIFFSPELMLLGMAFTGLVWLSRNPQRLPTFLGAETRALWLVPLCFVSVFVIKLLTYFWAIDPEQAINTAFNSIHFLLWPALVVFFRMANVSVLQTEKWAAASMFVLMIWYAGAKFFFPESENAQCFKAGAHHCGLLGQTMAFILLWLFIAVTRPILTRMEKIYIFTALLAGWIAFVGTLRRTEILGLLLGMVVVLFWRFGRSFSFRNVALVCGLCASLLMLSWPVIQPRFALVSEEVGLYMEGGDARIKALDTSVGARLEMYRIGFAAIQERPWLGWGAGLRPQHVPQFATDPSKPYGYSNFHQQYLQVILEVGLSGGMLALILLIYLYRRMILVPWQNGSRELVAILGAMFFTYAWKGLANGALLYSVTNSVFVFFSALIWAELTRSVTGSNRPAMKAPS